MVDAKLYSKDGASMRRVRNLPARYLRMNRTSPDGQRAAHRLRAVLTGKEPPMATTVNQPADTPRETPAPGPTNGTQGGPAKTRRSGIGRRAFLLTATTAALCGAGALAAPRAIPALEAQAQAMARTAMLRELDELEGVSLDAAIQAAELTRLGVRTIVLPLARFVALVGERALDLLLKSVDAARAALSTLRLNTAPLDAFRDVVISWQNGVATLPVGLNGYLTADIESAEMYLRALKRLVEHPRVN
jgi:hypothetical protein